MRGEEGHVWKTVQRSIIRWVASCQGQGQGVSVCVSVSVCMRVCIPWLHILPDKAIHATLHALQSVPEWLNKLRVFALCFVSCNTSVNQQLSKSRLGSGWKWYISKTTYGRRQNNIPHCSTIGQA